MFERGGREQRGRSLETAVVVDLERRGYQLGWIRVGTDLEVDVFAEHPVEAPSLVQVSLDTAAAATWDREVRALHAAADAHPDTRALLVTLDPTPPSRSLPGRITWAPASRFLLEGPLRAPLDSSQ